MVKLLEEELEIADFHVREKEFDEIEIKEKYRSALFWLFPFLVFWFLGCYFGVNWHEKIFGRIIQFAGLLIFPTILVNATLRKVFFKLVLSPDVISITTVSWLFQLNHETINTKDIKEISFENQKGGFRNNYAVYLILKDLSKRRILTLKVNADSKVNNIKLLNELNMFLKAKKEEIPYNKT